MKIETVRSAEEFDIKDKRLVFGVEESDVGTPFMASVTLAYSPVR
jgi:hypothetical protein